MEIKDSRFAQSEVAEILARLQGIKIEPSHENLQTMATTLGVALPDAYRFVVVTPGELSPLPQETTVNRSYVPSYQKAHDILVELPTFTGITEELLTLQVAHDLLSRRNVRDTRTMRWTAATIGGTGVATCLAGNTLLHSPELSIGGAMMAVIGLGIGMASGQPEQGPHVDASTHEPPLFVRSLSKGT